MTGGAGVLVLGLTWGLAWGLSPSGLAGQAVGVSGDPMPASLPVTEVVRLALVTHPGLAAATARLGVAESEAGRARSERLPTVGLLATGTRYREPMVVAPLHGFDLTSPPAFDETLYQGHARADYTLYDGGARSARIGAAARGVEAAEAGAAAVRDAVVAEAVSLYLEALTARDVRAAHGLRLAALGAEVGRSRLLFDQGKAPRVAVLRAEAAEAEAAAGLEGAKAALRLALRRLVRLAALDPSRVTAEGLVPLSPGGDAGEDRAELVARALESNPALLEARSRARAAEAAVGAARSAYLPRVELNGRYSAFGSGSTDPVLEWQAGLSLRYPVFTGGARGHGVARAEAAAAGAAAELAGAEREVADAVDAALAGRASARARVMALEAAVAGAAEVARIEALALEAGAGTQPDYLQAEAALLRSRAALAEARNDLLEAEVGLARLTGRLDEDWLARRTEGGTR